MEIKEFNFLLKESQSASVIKSAILIKLNLKATKENVGYITNIYDTAGKKLYLLVSDNVKTEYGLSDNIFDIGGGNSNIDTSLLATKEDLAQVQAGSVDLVGYLTEVKADGKYALKTELETLSSSLTNTINSTIDEKIQALPAASSTSSSNVDEAARINIAELQGNVVDLQTGIEALRIINTQEKQAIDSVYKTLYIKILELTQELENLKNSTQNAKVFTENDVPNLNTSLFASDVKTPEQIQAEQVLSEGGIDLTESSSLADANEDDVLIFD